jgi:NH3-dependent NAD+ synthetase
MVRAIINFDDAEYERLRQAASERGLTIEQFVVTEAIRAVPEAVPEKAVSERAEPTEAVQEMDDSIRPFDTWDQFFTWCDQQKLSTHGWKWNREELYDRKVFR